MPLSFGGSLPCGLLKGRVGRPLCAAAVAGSSAAAGAPATFAPCRGAPKRLLSLELQQLHMAMRTNASSPTAQRHLPPPIVEGAGAGANCTCTLGGPHLTFIYRTPENSTRSLGSSRAPALHENFI